ncbi:hypothetical protein FF38_01288 [Lucilia cuprina]|uniref:Uncharacterized protein n=1 Tax=Lucilia cuprina TaxID=7375 RepID=A0A0L0BUV6_LUCCU|nr:hypothetical protein FF38_01288 [Lucilia cuprina]
MYHLYRLIWNLSSKTSCSCYGSFGNLLINWFLQIRLGLF